MEVDGEVGADGGKKVVGNAPLPRRKPEPRNLSLPPQSRSLFEGVRQPRVRSKNPVYGGDNISGVCQPMPIKSLPLNLYHS